jgi:murein L,D-transpeptidase YafK
MFVLLAGAVTAALLGVSDSSAATAAARVPERTVAPATSAAVAPVAPVAADSLVVVKSARRLTLFHRGVPVREYRVALGANPVGDKVRQGDRRTPEGLFRIAARNPESRFHLSLRVSYPDAAHRARAAALGVSPGGDIMLHGLPGRFASVGVRHTEFDWTEGCVAVTNAEIEEIWRLVPNGAAIEIKP